MNRMSTLGILGMAVFFMSGCKPVDGSSLDLNVTELPTTTPSLQAVSPTTTPLAGAGDLQESGEMAILPLSEPGPYHAGNQVYTIVDPSRAGREIELLIWYPALKETDADGNLVVRGAAPDLSAGPYPLILTEENSGKYLFLSHLASHGFILVVVRSPKSIQGEILAEFFLIDVARDFLFALDQVSANPPEELEGMVDSERTGVTGYSYGGDITLFLSGARIDPEFYRSQCAQLEEIVPSQFQWVYRDYYCQDANNWEAFSAYAGEAMTTSQDGLWQPMTDARIRAVMPMAPTVSWYYGVDGLAAVKLPCLLIWGTDDIASPYPLEAAYTFDNLGSRERFLISFLGRNHDMPLAKKSVAQIRHFATAFFGYYLQGREDYGEYLSEESVSQYDNLVWGVYQGGRE